MGKVYEEIDDRLKDWIGRQAMYFVGTAPLAGDGHVNVSPKGPIGTLRVLGTHEVAYLDLVGSGAETIAHLRENSRIVVMLCAFAGPPRIVRLYGRGSIAQAGTPGFDELIARCDFDEPVVAESRRSVITVQVERVADSCGYGVPLMELTGLRNHHELTAKKRLRVLGPDGFADHVHDANAESIDGLPALER